MTTTTQLVIDVASLGAKSKDELLTVAHGIGLEDGPAINGLRRDELIGRIFQNVSNQQHLIATGVLEVMDEGYGFLRQMSHHMTGSDVYISQSQIRRFGLKTGDTVTGQVRPPKEGERYFGLVRVESVNDLSPEPGHSRSRTQFEYLTPIFPEQMLVLENESYNLSTRMIDLFSPIGLGQRGLIVSPPKAGKTTILKNIAHAVSVSIPTPS